MRWLTQIFLCSTLFALLTVQAIAQRGFGGHGTVPSSTALGMGATTAFPSSGNRGGFANSRGSYGGYSNGRGYSSVSGYGSSASVGSSSSGYGGRFRGDYRRVPYSYFFSPYYYPFLDYGSAPYGGGPGDVPDEQPYPDPAFMGQNALGQQVQRLTAEVDQLKYGPPPPLSARSSDPPPTPVMPITVVLRNGQTLQVQNYAVMDQTLWDFSKQPVRKIPVSNIDITASSQATAANGAEFPQIDTTP